MTYERYQHQSDNGFAQPEQNHGINSIVENTWSRPGAFHFNPGADSSASAHLPSLELSGHKGESASLSNQEQIRQFFENKGLSKEQVAGIMGNFQVEAPGFDPSQRQHGGGPGFGIAQWEGSRKRDLFKYAAEHGMPADDLNTQLNFAWHELQTTHKGALKALMQSHTVEQATNVFERKFEAAGKPNMPARLAAAQGFYGHGGSSFAWTGGTADTLG